MMNYSLIVRGIKSNEQFKKLSEYMKEFDLIKYAFNNGTYVQEDEEATYNSWEEQNWLKRKCQMVIISEKFPKMTFELTCQEKDIFWKEYYKDGFIEQCSGEIIFEKPRKVKWDELVKF